MGRMSKSFYQTYSLLKDWYGTEWAGTEITAYCPESVSIGEAADNLLKKVLSQDTLDVINLSGKWDEIAGRQIAKVATPSSSSKGVFYLEVSHPAWLRELNGPVKKHLIKKINSAFGEGFCLDLNFIPGGRNSDK